MRAEEWYDLAADPGEHVSAPPPGPAADGIRARAIARWRASRASGAPLVSKAVCLDAAQKERLRALGYVQSGADGSCPKE